MTKKIDESTLHLENSNEDSPLVQPGTAQRLRLRSNLRAGDSTPPPAPTGPREPSPPPPSTMHFRGW
jgi:hypothetical protein